MPLSKTGSKARFRHETVKPKGRFDPRSFRTVKARAHRVTVGCPKGKYSPKTKKCKVSTQVQKILHPKGEYKMMLKGKLNPLRQRIFNYAEVFAAKLYGQGMGVDSVAKAVRKHYKSISLADARYVARRVARIGRGAVKHPKKKVQKLASYPIMGPNAKRRTAKKNVRKSTKKKANPRKKWYYGPSVQHRGKILVFPSTKSPTKTTHGRYIRNAVGPYASKVTAMNAAKKCMN